MIRESLNPDSAHAFAAITPANGVAAQGRPSTGGVSFNTNQAGLQRRTGLSLSAAFPATLLFHILRTARAGRPSRAPRRRISQWVRMFISVWPLTAHDAALTCKAVFSNVTTTAQSPGSGRIRTLVYPATPPSRYTWRFPTALAILRS